MTAYRFLLGSLTAGRHHGRHDVSRDSRRRDFHDRVGYGAEMTSERPNLQPSTMAPLLEAAQVTPVIDRTYPLSQAAEALRYVGAGHTRGKVVITV